MKLLVIEDKNNQTGLMIVPDRFNKDLAIRSANRSFLSGHIIEETAIPEIGNAIYYTLYRMEQ